MSEHPFLSVEEAAQLVGRSEPTLRWFLNKTMVDKNPTDNAMEALRRVSPNDPGNFSTVIEKRKRKSRPYIRTWFVRQDFIEAYYNLSKARDINYPSGSDHYATILKKQRKEIAKEKSNHTPPPPANLYISNSVPALTSYTNDEQKAHLIAQRTDEVTREAIKALLVAVKNSQLQLKEKDEQVRKLLDNQSKLTDQLLLSAPKNSKQNENWNEGNQNKGKPNHSSLVFHGKMSQGAEKGVYEFDNLTKEKNTNKSENWHKNQNEKYQDITPDTTPASLAFQPAKENAQISTMNTMQQNNNISNNKNNSEMFEDISTDKKDMEKHEKQTAQNMKQKNAISNQYGQGQKVKGQGVSKFLLVWTIASFVLLIVAIVVLVLLETDTITI